MNMQNLKPIDFFVNHTILEHTFKIRIVPRDQLFSDKIFAKITLGLKIVGKFISEAVNN